MPPAQRRHDTGVIDQLLREPQQFDFFQAVRLLDRWMGVASPDGKGLSRVNFRNSLSLSFPPSQIESLQVHLRATDEASAGSAAGMPERVGGTRLAHEIDSIDMTPAFMGLLGVNGTLPLFYTEMLSQRELYQKDYAGRAFMDLFSHRA
ncbi:MAG: type VI secretion system baseplate subunit TssG, partial [Aquabacterium sp.]|uniref:type VI secretion system baseplate subunit TssG n=1 Tax=Aquabacterium sp. TaxID=1872578 RepID=UPI0012201228